LPEAAARAIARGFDPVNGGFGTAPKFPHALELRFLLRRWVRSRDESLLHVVRHSLDKMAAGGIYDQVGGGFHRYSTDAHWLVPHFEKMLYDNALLVPLYAEAWQATGEAEYRRIAEETLEYALREMTSPPGAFYSTQDADSEGEEGKFYVWTPAEIEAVLGTGEAQFVGYVYGVTEEGNFEGKNILHRAKTWEQLEKLLKSPADAIRARLKSAGAKLYEARSKRVWPGRDEKVLVSWNGLMIAAFARAGAAFGEPRFTAGAAKAADFILTHMVAADGTLFRTCAVGAPPRIPGYLEDYACFTDALVELYQAAFENRWLEAALRLADGLAMRFVDPAGGFFSTADDHKHLIARAKDNYDGSTPSGNSMAITALLKLAKLTDRADLRERAEAALRSFGPFMAESPGGAAQMLGALDFHLGPVTEIVVIGKLDAEDTRRVLKALRGRSAPNQLLVFHDPSTGPADEKLLPLLQGRAGGPEVMTYVCENQTCAAPMKGATAAEEWVKQKEH
jgi:uncharacterized protein YyaL (SSP411 family)